MFNIITTGHNNRNVLSHKDDYVSKLKEDLEISNDWIMCYDTNSFTYDWYMKHIDWLEAEIKQCS